MSLTQAYLKSILHYDPDTGIFTNRVARSNRVKPGAEAGGVTAGGYKYICVGGSKRGAHRLAFLYMLGDIPREDIDHINGFRHDNRWENLRAVSRQENMRNAKLSRSSISGIPGVKWVNSHKKWMAYIKVSGSNLHLKWTEDYFEAVCARKSAEILYGFHTNHGRTG